MANCILYGQIVANFKMHEREKSFIYLPNKIRRPRNFTKGYYSGTMSILDNYPKSTGMGVNRTNTLSDRFRVSYLEWGIFGVVAHQFFSCVMLLRTGAVDHTNAQPTHHHCTTAHVDDGEDVHGLLCHSLHARQLTHSY